MYDPPENIGEKEKTRKREEREERGGEELYQAIWMDGVHYRVPINGSIVRGLLKECRATVIASKIIVNI